MLCQFLNRLGRTRNAGRQCVAVARYATVHAARTAFGVRYQMNTHHVDALCEQLRNGIEPGKAGADLAQIIWNEQLTDARVVQLLNDNSELLRGEVAWAVADADRPTMAVEWLLEHGLWDTCSAVRFWTLKLIDDKRLGASTDSCRLRQLLCDPDVGVRALAERVLNQSKAIGD